MPEILRVHHNKFVSKITPRSTSGEFFFGYEKPLNFKLTKQQHFFNKRDLYQSLMPGILRVHHNKFVSKITPRSTSGEFFLDKKSVSNSN